MKRRYAAALVLAAMTAAPRAALADGEARPAGVVFAGTNLPLAEVLEKARPAKQVVVLDVVTDPCTWCRALDRDTFGAAEVAKALDGCVTARYDAGQEGGRAVADRFRVRAYPTVVFVDAEGNELDRVVGYLPPARFVAEAERIRRGVGTLPALAALHANDPESLPSATAYARKLVRAGELSLAEPLLRRVVEAKPDDKEARPSAMEGLAELALARLDPRGALAWYARIDAEYPASEVAADAWISRIQILSREGSAAEALEAVAGARARLTDPEKVMVVEQLAFRLHRQELEASLVRWGEKADLAKDAESLHAAAKAALEARVALGTATRWAEHAVDLSKRDPAMLDTLARLVFQGGDLAAAYALETEAVATTKDPDAKAAYAAELARFGAALRAPPPPPTRAPSTPPAGSATRATPASPSPKPPPCDPAPVPVVPSGPCR